jgi:hypothetical protein
MDTRFWGPSGWRLLHLVAHAAPELPPQSVHEFFTLLPYILPCKFCRASLTDYIAADPVPHKASEYAHWIYRIHNRVNGKLRDQKLLKTPDPKWEEIHKRYTDWLSAPCVKRRMVGWDFLFSVAYTTPCPSVTTAPMAGAPPLSALTTPTLRNRWAVISREERLPYMARWWSTLPKVLPFAEWHTAWARVVPKAPSLQRGRKAITAWLYSAEKAMCAALKEDLPHDSFTGLCSELSTFASGCGSKRSKRTKTCRAKRTSARSTLQTRRAHKFKMVGGFL